MRLKGEATRDAGSGVEALSPSSVIYSGDIIRTGAGARILIVFEDNSELTLSENAVVTIDRFVHDASAEASPGRQAIDFAKGIFRFTTGRIGKLAPQEVALNTPVATIGIRGTDFVGGELTVGMPVGRSHYGFQIREGAIEVLNPEGSVILDDVGEGTFLPLNAPAAPQSPRQWSEAEQAEADQALAF